MLSRTTDHLHTAPSSCRARGDVIHPHTRCVCGWSFVDGVGQVPVLDLGSVASSGLWGHLFMISWPYPDQVTIVLLIDHRHIKAQSWHYQPESVKQPQSVKLPAHSQRDVYQLPDWKAYFVCIWWWHRVCVVVCMTPSLGGSSDTFMVLTSKNVYEVNQ